MSVPEIIPSPQRLSISYEDIEKSETLGTGGNADVYRATAYTDLGEFILAIKEPRVDENTVDVTTTDQMIEEAETWQQLDDHDHVVSVIDYGSTPLPWIGMEYMDGGDLSERSGEMSFEQALWTALAITRAVRYAHKRGVAHLDLKPSNILLRSVEDAWDVPKVADWGLSKHLLKHSQSVEGMSPRYAAPEQLDSEQFGQTDSATDIYQLGTVFYELFTGEPPFEGQTYEVMNKIQTETPVPLSERADIPEAIDDILLTALATEKHNRYDDIIYLRDELQDIWNKNKNIEYNTRNSFSGESDSNSKKNSSETQTASISSQTDEDISPSTTEILIMLAKVGVEGFAVVSIFTVALMSLNVADILSADTARIGMIISFPVVFIVIIRRIYKFGQQFK